MIVERNAAGPDRGIEAAIKHFHNGDLDIAITLAPAGEGQPPETTKEYLFRMLRRLAPNDDFNLFITWLKHPVGPENATILEFEAVLVIARAITQICGRLWGNIPTIHRFR
jgi:hypothetical protein